MDREAARPRTFAFKVHPQLMELETTRQLLDRYKLLLRKLPALSWKRTPPEVIFCIARLISSRRPDQQLMSDLKRQKVQVYRFVSTCRKLVWIERTLEGEVTNQSLRDRQQEVYELLNQLHAPFQFVQFWLKRYQKRPRGQPARKRVEYLKALDYKRSHPETTWAQLAEKFCGSVGDHNKLKSWILQTKATMSDIGIEVDLRNPNYPRRPVNKGSH